MADLSSAMYQAACTTLKTIRKANRYKGLSFNRSGLPYPPLMIQVKFCDAGEKKTKAWQNQNAETMCQRKIVAGVRGFVTKIFIVIQVEGVHRRPILKVLRGIMKIIRLVIQNRAARNPAGPRGNMAQKREEMLAGNMVNKRMDTGIVTYCTSLQRQQRQRGAIVKPQPQHAANEYAILKSNISCMGQLWVPLASLRACFRFVHTGFY